jgi:hypothetical protein
VFALIVDSILAIAVTFTHWHDGENVSGGAPTLTLSPNRVNRGQKVVLHISHCQPFSHVLLSHDLQEPLHLNTPSPLIQVNATGDAIVHMLVDESWKLGEHDIEAEEISTHFAFRATLQVTGAGVVQPPLLHISQTSLDMGAQLQGANTLQPLQLQNAGGGMIAWVATSDQPWLTLSPTQGVFSDRQDISLAATRADLKPGNYKGTITLTSNTGSAASLHVTMSVLPIPADAGAVLVVTPARLAFTATDGGLDPTEQVLVVSNPGSRPLSWFCVQPPSGIVAPHATEFVHVIVHSHKLLAGMYSSTLTFTADRDTLNNSEVVAISLNVQQHCGVAATMRALAFTIAAGQKKSQLLNLGVTPGCAPATTWEAFSLASWLTVTPNSGQAQPKAGVLTTVEVHGGQLKGGVYHGFIMFLTAQHTETVPVQLNVLSSSPTVTGSPVSTTPPSSSTSSLAVSPADLSFTVTQGQASSGSQSVTLSNTGSGSFGWHAEIVSIDASWLSILPTPGPLAARQPGQLVVNIDASQLVAGTYRAQISITAMDAFNTPTPGSPQMIPVTLHVLAPCSLQVTPARLSFTTSLQQPDPPGQSITLKAAGGCAQPVRWKASMTSNSSSWLTLSATSGTDSGMGSIITVNVNAEHSLPGSYRRGMITITITDNNGFPMQDSLQRVLVVLNGVPIQMRLGE